MRCPVDSHALKSIFSAEVNIEIDVCDLCHGIWFDSDELAKAVAYLRITLPITKGKDVFMAHVDDTHKAHQSEKYICPRDEVVMETYTYAGDSGIYIDRCVKCSGFWLNGGELEKLKKYIAPNPLEEAVGQVVVTDMKDLERIKKESAELIAQLGGISSPGALIVLLVCALSKQVMKKITEGNNDEKIPSSL